MIPITLKPEPPDFDTRVRRPGNEFLGTNPNPTNKELRNKQYWTRSLKQLRTAYNCICAYSACWIPTQGTVDHFLPKANRPDLAYEWSNLRLASEKLNNYKADSTSVADPMNIKVGWFTIDFDNFYVAPGSCLPKEIRHLVMMTIQTLKLNSDDALVNLRFEIARDFAKGDVSIQFLKKRYPFVASELERQNLAETIKTRFI